MRLPKAITADDDQGHGRHEGGREQARGTNKPPIDRLVTKPRMIRLMQGGIVSAMTAEAASSATASPGLLPGLPCRGDQNGTHGRDVGHLGPRYAGEDHHAQDHDDVKAAAQAADPPLQETR